MADQDYCQYIISKCVSKGCSKVTNGAFRTTKAFMDSYVNSQSFSSGAKVRDRRIQEWASDLIYETRQNIGALGIDARMVLNRCQQNIDSNITYEKLFTVLSDFLWVIASNKATKNRVISLTDDFLDEQTYAIEWIDKWNNDMANAKYDLDCMLEAENLPLAKQIFQGFIDNPDVAQYVNRDFISYEDFKQRITDCKSYIKRKEQLYYAFVATIIYREDLRRRYR